MSRLRGASNLLFDLVDDTTKIVEETQRSVWKKTVDRISKVPPLEGPAKTVQTVAEGSSSAVFSAVRTISRGVQQVADVARDALEPEDRLTTPVRADAAGSVAWWVDHAQTAVNGMYGDLLADRENELDLGMTLRDPGGHAIPLEADSLKQAFSESTSKLVVFVHGLGVPEWCWSFKCDEYWGDPERNFGTELRAELGYTPIYVRYNTGRHISQNGRALAELLERMVQVYPTGIDELMLIGHSMGGLVVRSAAHVAREMEHGWLTHLRHIFCLGSPHLGAPLEKAVNIVTGALDLFDASGARVPARLLKNRSAGIKDLRFGYTVDSEWEGRDADAVMHDHRENLPLIDGVNYYFVGGTVAQEPGSAVGRLVGDILVCPPSASGQDRAPTRRIPFHGGELLGGLEHASLMSHPSVYAAIRSLLV